MIEGVDDPSFPEAFWTEEWMQSMRGCAQDPIHHAEGDVFTHVNLVCAELTKLEEYRELPRESQQILAWAALLHDVAKPFCSISENGRIKSPGHARKGALTARRILWLRDCPFALREEICSLVRYHMRVFWALEQDSPERLVREISLHCRCRYLAILAQADALGRECSDRRELLDKVQLFRQLAEESECLDRPARFASESSRYLYFQEKWHNPELEPYADFRCEVIMLSGLPGAGKDTWIRRHAPCWPVISLDDIRTELGIPPTGPQGKTLETARLLAREYLRRGESFIWNATNISRLTRRKVLSLFFDYGARVRIVYLETSAETMDMRNRGRARTVPYKAVARMIEKWDVPSLTEAHRVDYNPI